MQKFYCHTSMTNHVDEELRVDVQNASLHAAAFTAMSGAQQEVNFWKQ